jgi:2-keto-4-pentenoate hydratase/2-oxohepta-3-ene-1,7-dioic acid hydratase in catechol pathway
MDYDEEFFSGDGVEGLRRWVEENAVDLPRVESTVRLGAAICRPSKIVCIGLNYRDHAAETGAPIPKEPVIFFKATTSLVGPNDPLVRPKGSTKVDWEVELAVVIGKRALYVSKENALDYVAGYVLHNDYSERNFQLNTADRSGRALTLLLLGPFRRAAR